MAFDFSKLNFFSKLDARSRVVVLLLGTIGFILIIYFGSRYFFGGEGTVGPSRVAAPPPGLQSVPGGELIPAYQQALEEANIQREQQARMRGESAVPTMIRAGGPTQPVAGGEPCTIVCSEKSVNVKDYLDDWTRQGKISPEIASNLQNTANKNVSVDEYAAGLDELIKQGKITPEQARDLLEQYRKQHANALLQESSKTMDDLIKKGQLPLTTANQLLIAQKGKLNPTRYAALQREMINEGQLTPDAAQRLLAQYTQQFTKEVIDGSLGVLQGMARKGEIIPEVFNEVADLEKRMVPLNELSASLNKFVDAGKLTPIIAKKIQDEYIRQKAAIGVGQSVDELVKKAVNEALQEISDLVRAGKMSPDVAAQLSNMIQRDVPFEQFEALVQQLVQQNKLAPDISVLKLQDYRKVKQLQALKNKLSDMQANNVPVSRYAEELKKAVQSGAATPQEAAQAMQEYQSIRQSELAPPSAPIEGVTPEFAALQERLRQGEAETQQVAPTPAEFEVAQTQVQQETAQDRQARIDALANAMNGQASQLIAFWEPPTLEHKEGVQEEKTETSIEKTNILKAGAGGDEGGLGGGAGIPIIKAGTIIFGVLDTTVNSDYPDTPVMVTIVEGRYKGAKLLGKLNTATNVAGQLDRVSLTFTLMNMDEWPRSKGITAFAIDPDTARTAIASSVNYHYLKRFGAIMATSFIQGYANAIQTSGSTTTTGIFGTSTQHPKFSTGEKLASAIGQIGTNLGAVTQNYVNIPPTVRVDAGASLGILFMADVTA